MSGVLMTASCALAAAFAILLLMRDARQFGLARPDGGWSGRTAAKPTGGGLALLLAGTLAGGYVAAHTLWPALLLVLVAGAAGAAGLAADLGRLGPMPRLLAEAVLLAAIVCFGMPVERLPALLGLELPSPLLASVVVLAGVAWIGVFSAMDRVEGLAVTQALFLLIAGVGLAVSTGQGIFGEPTLWWLLGLGAAFLVLLPYAWPPARLHLGETGRVYAGFVIFALALATVFAGWLTFWEWLILVAPAASDAAVALLRRAAAGRAGAGGRPAYAMEMLASRRASHRGTVLGFLGIELFWLYPLALYAHNHRDWGAWTTVIAYVPLLALAYLAGAGRQRHDQLG